MHSSCVLWMCDSILCSTFILTALPATDSHFEASTERHSAGMPARHLLWAKLCSGVLPSPGQRADRMEPAAIANHWIPHTLSSSVWHAAVVSLDISSGGGGNVSSSYFAVEVIASRLGYIIQLIQYYTSIAFGGILCYGATSTAIFQQCPFAI